LELAADLTRARVDGGSAAPQLTGLRPALTPEVAATAALDWRVGERLSLSGEVRYESARFDDDLNTRRIAGGAVAGARATWRVTSAVSLYLAADNVFNSAIQTSRSADGVVTYDAPRMVRIGASLRR
jgi:outer membrane receptor protein involved in Fe transport